MNFQFQNKQPLLPGPCRFICIFIQWNTCKNLKLMKNYIAILVIMLFISSCRNNSQPIASCPDSLLSDTIQYHPVRVDCRGAILPWYSADIGTSYDTCLMLVWDFWKKMPLDSNGLKYHMNHQVWRPEHDSRGLGGDQMSMALSSFILLYQYTGDRSIIAEMQYIADEYLARSLSRADAAWPNIPYPYNTSLHSGRYDGDMRDGLGSTQPDKAGNFANDLVALYKITGDRKYLHAAVKIARTLASHTIAGDSIRSPLPFRVNAKTGKTGRLLSNTFSGKVDALATYTSNWTGTMLLFESLAALDPEGKEQYHAALTLILEWMKKYPLRTNKWGPFFEDIPGWSDTQTNAVSFAMFIMQHREFFPNWQNDVKGIFEWTYKELGNHEYEKYGVTVMNEQTVYRVPGNSHSSRQASMEIWYSKMSGDTSFLENALRTLNWATYTVAHDGRNRYIRDDIWLTDGYGDYIRHYLRAMAAMPELAPVTKNKLLFSTSVITSISYSDREITYITFDENSEEVLRLKDLPVAIYAGSKKIPNDSINNQSCWKYTTLDAGFAVGIKHLAGKEVRIVLK
jgi:hypothetical protein